jgi:septal ring factor EnvC (AmiA/AmiB activator)
MAITAPSLIQAREALGTLTYQRQQLFQTVQQQGKKIVDLENEVQRMATALASSQQNLADAKIEIQSLRSQLPDAATVRAYEDLVEHLSGTDEAISPVRLVAA